ncbi:MAG TPA: hypothetical protein VK195_03965 [Burkholderiaceae bacterium]|nr:hypothetical protein [Burkholderiaceae bacterium]
MATEHSRYFHPRHGVVLVKKGFCWPALFFGSLWAAARRSYPLFGLMLLVETLLWGLRGFAAARQHQGLAGLAALLMLVYVGVRGFYGNRWIERRLLARGYRLRPLVPPAQAPGAPGPSGAEAHGPFYRAPWFAALASLPVALLVQTLLEGLLLSAATGPVPGAGDRTAGLLPPGMVESLIRFVAFGSGSLAACRMAGVRSRGLLTGLLLLSGLAVLFAQFPARTGGASLAVWALAGPAGTLLGAWRRRPMTP